MKLLWVVSNNRKTGAIPSAYVGTTADDAWRSCEGCELRESKRCYAWVGLTNMIFKGQHVARFARQPERFSLASVLARRGKALAARIGVLGDPSRADRPELLSAIATIRELGLAVLSYTHFWRDRENAELSKDLMASCDTPEQADEALVAGWRPTAILPWDFKGTKFTTPGGALGVVCPAQKKEAVTCDSCRMCDPRHPVWAAGRIDVIGFVEHSPPARGAQKRASHDKTLPLYREPLSGWNGHKAPKPKGVHA